MNNFVINTKKQKYKKTKLTQMNITIAKKGKDKKKMLKNSDIEVVADRLLKDARKKNKNAKLIVRADNIIQTYTLKSMNEDIDDMFNDEEDYFENVVAEEKKFHQFYQATYTLIY